MSSKYEDLIKNARINADCGEHMSPEEVTTLLNVVETTFAALAAENAGLKDFVKTCFRAAADGASLDGADIQELGERLGLFGRETYQPALHGYICGHEAGEDTVYVMKKTPATDAFLAEVRAQGVDVASEHLITKFEGTGRIGVPVMALEWLAKELRKGVQS